MFGKGSTVEIGFKKNGCAQETNPPKELGRHTLLGGDLYFRYTLITGCLRHTRPRYSLRSRSATAGAGSHCHWSRSCLAFL